MNSLIVSTQCPSCGASLDFNEGSNAVKCGHCGSNLLVTGRKQVLSYYVSPKLDERRAVAEATKAQRDRGRVAFTGLKAKMYFLPYYRMTGQDLNLAKSPPKEKDVKIGADEEENGSLWNVKYSSSSFSFGRPIPDAAGGAFNFIINVTTGERSGSTRRPVFRPNFGSLEDENRAAEAYFREAGGQSVGKDPLHENGEMLLNYRYVEKNFMARDLKGLGPYSLGVRPTVLKLELFRKAVLDPVGKTVGPDLNPEAAEAVGLKMPFDPALLYRKVIGKVLSIIYFPFWFIEMKSRGEITVTIIDAVSQSVIKADADASIYNCLNQDLTKDPEIIDFRPLVCPNCGWDLDVRPNDIIFVCRSCARAWQIKGSSLTEISYRVVETAAPRKEAKYKYLPFWILTKSGDKAPFKFFIPAFRYRRLEVLLNIALQLSKLQLPCSFTDTKPDMLGCYYDSEDAFLMAQFTQSIMASEKIEEFKSSDDLLVSESVLAWLPFELQGDSLIFPAVGLRLQKCLLV